MNVCVCVWIVGGVWW